MSTMPAGKAIQAVGHGLQEPGKGQDQDGRDHSLEAFGNTSKGKKNVWLFRETCRKKRKNVSGGEKQL